MTGDDEVVRQQVLLEGYKEKEGEEVFLLVLPLLLKSFIDDVNSLGVSKLSAVPWNELTRLNKRVARNQERAAAPGLKALSVDMKELAADEAAFTAELLDSDEIPRSQQWAPVEETPIAANGQSFTDFLPFWVAAHTVRLGNLTRRAWANGMPVQDVISQVRGTRARRFKDGLLHGALLRDIRFTVSMAVQHVTSAVRAYAMRASGVRRYRWVSVLDGKTSPICRSLSGREFDFGKGPRPPAHPNCRSTIAPSMGAQGPANETYYSWLKRQPAGFQDEVLGRTRAKVFRDGGISAEAFADLNLNRYFRPRTLKEMRALAPVVFNRAGVDV